MDISAMPPADLTIRLDNNLPYFINCKTKCRCSKGHEWEEFFGVEKQHLYFTNAEGRRVCDQCFKEWLSSQGFGIVSYL